MNIIKICCMHVSSSQKKKKKNYLKRPPSSGKKKMIKAVGSTDIVSRDFPQRDGGGAGRGVGGDIIAGTFGKKGRM